MNRTITLEVPDKKKRVQLTNLGLDCKQLLAEIVFKEYENIVNEEEKADLEEQKRELFDIYDCKEEFMSGYKDMLLNSKIELNSVEMEALDGLLSKLYDNDMLVFEKNAEKPVYIA